MTVHSVGRAFTFAGKRYETGTRFDLGRVAEYRRPVFRRLYRLEPVADIPVLAAMKKADLVDLATAEGIDLPEGSTKAEIIELLED